MFQYGVAIGALPGNPFREVRNRDRVRPRDRVLSMEEIGAIWRAAGRMYYPWSPLFRLLLLTARSTQRVGRGAMAVGGQRGHSPSRSRHANTRPRKLTWHHSAPRCAPVVRGLPPAGFGPYLLTSDGGKTAISGFSKAKLQLDDLVVAELDGAAPQPWVLHDLRRSMATHMERLGITPHLVEALPRARAEGRCRNIPALRVPRGKACPRCSCGRTTSRRKPTRWRSRPNRRAVGRGSFRQQPATRV